MKYFIVYLCIVILFMCMIIEHQMDRVVKVRKNYQILREELNRSYTIVGLFENHYRVPKVYRFVNPVYWEDRKEYQLSSPYGYRELLNPFTGGTRTSEHMGLDMVGTWHARLKPISPDGVIEDKWVVPNGALGYKGHDTHGGYVIVRLPDDWKYTFSHMSVIYVRIGDMIKDWKIYRKDRYGKWLYIGDFIGRMGNTGQSAGEHLHLAIQNPEGRFVNPLQYVDMKH